MIISQPGFIDSAVLNKSLCNTLFNLTSAFHILLPFFSHRTKFRGTSTIHFREYLSIVRIFLIRDLIMFNHSQTRNDFRNSPLFIYIYLSSISCLLFIFIFWLTIRLKSQSSQRKSPNLPKKQPPQKKSISKRNLSQSKRSKIKKQKPSRKRKKVIQWEIFKSKKKMISDE